MKPTQWSTGVRCEGWKQDVCNGTPGAACRAWYRCCTQLWRRGMDITLRSAACRNPFRDGKRDSGIGHIPWKPVTYIAYSEDKKALEFENTRKLATATPSPISICGDLVNRGGTNTRRNPKTVRRIVVSMSQFREQSSRNTVSLGLGRTE